MKYFCMLLMGAALNANAGAFHIEAASETNISLGKGETQRVTYIVTNLSDKPHYAHMNEFRGGKLSREPGTCVRGQIYPKATCKIIIEVIADQVYLPLPIVPHVCMDDTNTYCDDANPSQRLRVTLRK